MIIGIDDTDSREGMCTTYLASVLLERIPGKVGLPLLVRLNPNIRYKTRGNAALALRAQQWGGIEKTVLETVEEMAALESQNTNPGVVFLEEREVTPDLKGELRRFSLRAVREVLEVSEAKRILEEYDGIAGFGFKNQRGLIGALAAVGFAVCGLPDCTYELIAYRQQARWGTPRCIQEETVWEADRLTYPLTWDTVDHANREIVFAPGSPDPVLFGIRGDSIPAIKKAFQTVRSEPVERVQLFLTNQGTDMHLVPATIERVGEERSYILQGEVSQAPWETPGGHVFFKIKDGTGEIKCAAFEPTKNFRGIVRLLKKGDQIKVYGGVKKHTLNLEKLEIEKLVTTETRNPPCPRCGRTMKSAGRNQGYRCRRCGTKKEGKDPVTIERGLEPGLYEVPPRARRHLAMPLVRLRLKG